MRKVIIQQSLSPWVRRPEHDAGFLASNHDMLRLTYQRHAAYARAHQFDFWSIQGTMFPEMSGGGYDKVHLINRGLESGYDYVVWLDADAAIMDFDVDLVDALPEGKVCAAVMHDPAKSAFLQQYNVPAHYNIGVTYWRNCDIAKQWAADWFDTYPGEVRWQEQGAFNTLLEKYGEHFHRAEDRFNATVAVNEVEKPVVKGYHGVSPIARRLAMMRVDCANDFLKFRV